MARHLEERVPEGTVRVATDGRTVADVARDVVAAVGWWPSAAADEKIGTRHTHIRTAVRARGHFPDG